MVGYPSAYAKTMQWYDRQMSTMQRNRDGSPPVPLPVQSTVAQPVRNTPARAPQRYQNCSRRFAAQSSRVSRAGLSLATRMINSSAITVQIGWFQVLKGYIPEDWTSMQEGFYRSQRSNSERSIHKQWTKNLSSSSGRQRPGRSRSGT
jgi:hypothetical protein